MDEPTCVKLLDRHGIRATSNRILVLKTLASQRSPSSLTELENLLPTVDKSGIFRSLVVFRDCHLVHSLEDGEGGIKYELCTSEDHEDDDDRHVHFFCERCHRLICLHDTPVPAVDVPSGYTIHTANLTLRGICPACLSREGRSRT